MPLTDTAIRNLKPSDKPQSVADERGLSIHIQPNGSKWWRFRYRFNDKAKMLGEDAQNQQMALQTALQNQPVNMLNAVRTGSQVTNPTFGISAQQATTSGADLTGALQGSSNYNLGLYNSKVAENNANTSKAVSAVGTGAMLYSGLTMF